MITDCIENGKDWIRQVVKVEEQRPPASRSEGHIFQSKLGTGLKGTVIFSVTTRVDLLQHGREEA